MTIGSATSAQNAFSVGMDSHYFKWQSKINEQRIKHLHDGFQNHVDRLEKINAQRDKCKTLFGGISLEQAERLLRFSCLLTLTVGSIPLVLDEESGYFDTAFWSCGIASMSLVLLNKLGQDHLTRKRHELLHSTFFGTML